MRQRSKEQRSIVRYIPHETKDILNYDLFSSDLLQTSLFVAMDTCI